MRANNKSPRAGGVGRAPRTDNKDCHDCPGSQTLEVVRMVRSDCPAFIQFLKAMPTRQSSPGPRVESVRREDTEAAGPHVTS